MKTAWLWVLLGVLLGLGMASLRPYEFYPVEADIPSGYRLNRWTGSLWVLRGGEEQRVLPATKELVFRSQVPAAGAPLGSDVLKMMDFMVDRLSGVERGQKPSPASNPSQNAWPAKKKNGPP